MASKRKITILKIVAILILAVVGFHFSGIETAFCKTSVDAQSSKSFPNPQGCLNCQLNHHVAIQNASMNAIPAMSSNFTFSEPHFFIPKDHSFSFFRPPISL